MAQYTVKKAFNFIKLRDVGHLILACLVFPFAIIAKMFIRGFWLVCEDRNEARDNGYWFFKWVRENHPEQKIAYAINKKSVDYDKVKKLGKIIGYGTISHWFWYIVADKNISSQKGGKPNAAVCYLFEVVLGMRKNNRVFLQHGVIINKLEWLFYRNTYFKLFITSTRMETDYVIKEFGYPADRVKELGLSRFDNLHNAKVDNDLILIMPTWRNWLGRESKDNKDLVFTETEYFKKWNGVLNSTELADILDKYNKKVLFYPHRNMQKFISDFNVTSDRITIADWREYDVQDLLKRAALLITDYSSVFFDFAYMCKPIIFYQFDEAEFRAKQYEQGYFDYRNNSISLWSNDIATFLANLKNILCGGVRTCDVDDLDVEFAKDGKCHSEKIYMAVKGL